MKNPHFNFLSKHFDKILIFFVLIVAAFYRLYRIEDYMTFLGDEGRDVMIVYKILHGNLTLLGPTASVGGFFLGPIYYYFMAPFLWLFNYNPVGPAIMVALFGIATVWLIYKVGKEFFGSSVGLIASGLYAISPLVVTYSRSSWNPNPMPFFSLLTLYLVYRAVKDNRVKLFILSGFLLGIAMQLHYLTLFLGVIVAAYIFTNWLFKGIVIQRLLKQYFYIFLGFIIGWSPFLAFEFRHNFTNTISIFNFIFRPIKEGTNINNTFVERVGDVSFRLFGRLVANFPAPEKISSWVDAYVSYWHTASIILGVAGIGILLYKCVKTYKQNSPKFTKLSLIAIWLIIGVGLFGFYRKSIYDYYLGFMFPLPFLIIGILLKNLFSVSGMGKLFTVLILIILIWLNSLTPPYKYPANRQLNQVEEISRFVIGKTDNKPFNFALITGGNSDHGYRYFFTVWQKEPVTIQNEEIDPERRTVTDQLLIVCEVQKDLCYPLGNSLWEVAGFGRAEIVEKWDTSVVTVFKLKRYVGK